VESVGEGQGFPLALPFGEQLAERDHGRNVAVSGPKVNRAARRAAMGSGRESLPRPDAEPDLGKTSSGARPDRLPAVPCRAGRAEEQVDGGFVAIRGCSRGHIEHRSAGESFPGGKDEAEMTPPSEGRSVRTGERFPGYTKPRKGGIEPRAVGPNRGRRHRIAETVIEPRKAGPN
jgi:hypothetical protein